MDVVAAQRPMTPLQSTQTSMTGSVPKHYRPSSVRDAERQAEIWRGELSEIEKSKRSCAIVSTGAVAIIILVSLIAAFIIVSLEQRAAAARALDFQATETALAIQERGLNLTRTVDARIEGQTATAEMRAIIALSFTPTHTFTPTFILTPTPSDTYTLIQARR